MAVGVQPTARTTCKVRHTRAFGRKWRPNASVREGRRPATKRRRPTISLRDGLATLRGPPRVCNSTMGNTGCSAACSRLQTSHPANFSYLPPKPVNDLTNCNDTILWPITAFSIVFFSALQIFFMSQSEPPIFMSNEERNTGRQRRR